MRKLTGNWSVVKVSNAENLRRSHAVGEDHGPVAQSAEHTPEKRRVTGSTPVRTTTKAAGQGLFLHLNPAAFYVSASELPAFSPRGKLSSVERGPSTTAPLRSASVIPERSMPGEMATASL